MWKKIGIGAMTIGASLAALGGDVKVRVLRLDTAEKAALGIRDAKVQAARSDLLLATAQVLARPGGEVAVTAPYPGQVTRLLTGVGDRVDPGTRLAQFTSPMLGEARRQWEEARLNAQTLRAALARDQAMLDEGIVPAIRVQLSQSRVNAAQATLQAREAELQAAGLHFDTEGAAAGYASGVLLAPIRGVVAEAFGQLGQRVEAGTVLFRLVDDQQLQLELQLSADKAPRVRAGDMIEIPERGARARITGISPALQAGQMARARASVIERGRLALGEALSVSIQASSHAGDKLPAWRVPARALTLWRGQPVIFIEQVRGYRAEPVKVLSSNDDVAIVGSDAMAVGQSVAVTGIAALRALLQKDE